MKPGMKSAPWTCAVDGVRLVALALARRQVHRYRREWPRPTGKRRPARRPVGQRAGSQYA